MLEGLKRSIQERIERNAVKIPNITWEKKNGEVVTEDIVLKRSRFPLIGDWSRVYPPLNENGKVNWLNVIFGGYKNFFRFLFIMFILYMIYSWVTGILGVNAQYLNGNDYIIIGKETFGKFCSTEIYDTLNQTQLQNLNISVFQ